MDEQNSNTERVLKGLRQVLEGKSTDTITNLADIIGPPSSEIINPRDSRTTKDDALIAYIALGLVDAGEGYINASIKRRNVSEHELAQTAADFGYKSVLERRLSNAITSGSLDTDKLFEDFTFIKKATKVTPPHSVNDVVYTNIVQNAEKGIPGSITQRALAYHGISEEVPSEDLVQRIYSLACSTGVIKSASLARIERLYDKFGILPKIELKEVSLQEYVEDRLQSQRSKSDHSQGSIRSMELADLAKTDPEEFFDSMREHMALFSDGENYTKQNVQRTVRYLGIAKEEGLPLDEELESDILYLIPISLATLPANNPATAKFRLHGDLNSSGLFTPNTVVVGEEERYVPNDTVLPGGLTEGLKVLRDWYDSSGSELFTQNTVVGDEEGEYAPKYVPNEAALQEGFTQGLKVLHDGYISLPEEKRKHQTTINSLEGRFQNLLKFGERNNIARNNIASGYISTINEILGKDPGAGPPGPDIFIIPTYGLK